MMTAKEKARMRKLELENKELRAELDKATGIYRESLYERVDQKIKLEMIREILESSESNGWSALDSKATC